MSINSVYSHLLKLGLSLTVHFGLLSAAGLANAQSPDSLPGSHYPHQECYSGLIPGFITDPATGNIGYRSFSAKRLGDSDACELNSTPLKLFYSTHTVKPIKLSASKVVPAFRDTETDLSGKPLANPEKNPTSSTIVYSETPNDKPVTDSVLRPKYSLKTLRDMNIVDPTSLGVDVESAFYTRRFSGVIGNRATIDGRSSLTLEPDNKTRELETADTRDGFGIQSFQQHIVALPEFSSNYCWLIVPQSILRHDMDNIRYLEHPDTYGVKFHRDQDLTIYYLGGQTKSGICTNPYFNQTMLSSLGRAFDYNGSDPSSIELSELGVTSETISKLLTQSVTATNTNTNSQPFKIEFQSRENRENNFPFGVDYTKISRSATTIDLVYQEGFPSDADDEKFLRGSLSYIRIRKSDDETPIKQISKINLSSECSLDGWIHSPKFSQKGEYLYFLEIPPYSPPPHFPNNHNTAIWDAGKPYLRRIDLAKASSNLTSEPNAPITEFTRCNDAKTSIFPKYALPDEEFPDSERFHIQNYKISSDNRKLSITFEKRGQSVVEFFKLNPATGEILYRYPEKIKGIGKIFDYVANPAENRNSGQRSYFVFHSNLNHPTQISRCTVDAIGTSCGPTDSAIDQSYMAKMPLESNLRNRDDLSSEVTSNPGKRRNANKVVVSEFNVPINVTADEEKEWKTSGENIHGFKLTPSGDSEGVIISIHGGPNDAWNGGFSEREFRLAQLGYTVYLPNPRGSTGYGFDFAYASKESWGTKILDDVKAVIKHVRGNHPKHKGIKLSLMGYSFGGYIVNLIQVKPDDDNNSFTTRNYIDGGMIAINPVFDIKQFAHSTDQLWFPEFQLGTSGTACFGKNRAHCTETINNELKDQNPIHLFDTNNANPRKPTLFILGTYDQRIHFCSNAPDMLAAHRTNEIPYSLQLEKYGFHEFDTNTNFEHGRLVHRWIESIAKCGDSDMKCPIIGSPIFDHRTNGLLFDNDLPYKGYQKCLKDLDVHL